MDRWFQYLRLILHKARPLMLFALIGAVFYLGVFTERTGFVREVLDPNLKRITLPVLNAFKGKGPDTPILRISLAAADLDSLNAIRERAMVRGVLSEGKDNYYPAEFTLGKEEQRGKLRLKGGLTDHVEGEKWSYRVQLDSGSTLFGMHTFSVQHPNTRNFTYEWIFHQVLRMVNLPSLNYDFINIVINNRNLGLYAIEEHFNDSLIARLGKYIGPVIKFDDEVRIEGLEQIAERPFEADPPASIDWFAAPVDAFHKGDFEDDPEQMANFQQQVVTLESFRRGRLPARRVFDVRQMARLFALSDLFGAQHCNDMRNLRWVTDSITHLLVPIGFDADAGEPIRAIRALREQGPLRFQVTDTSGLYERLFADTAFYLHYIRTLDSISAPGWLERTMQRMEVDLKEEVDRIRMEFPRFEHDPAIFQHCRAIIRQTLRPRTLIEAHWDAEKGLVEVAAIHGLPLEVTGIILGNDTLRTNKIVLPRKQGTPMRFQALTLGNGRSTEGEASPPILLFRPYGLVDIQSVKVKKWKTDMVDRQER